MEVVFRVGVSIAICDDQEYFRDQICELLDCYDWGCTTRLSTDTYANGEDLIDEIQAGKHYDIVFLDVLLKKSMGFDVGIMLKALLPDILLVYITSYTKYSVNILKAEPFYFIEKPVCSHMLYHVLERCIERIRFLRRDYIYSCAINGAEHKIDLLNVLYFESSLRVVKLHTYSDVMQFYGKLDKVEKDISIICNFFLRPNKSYLINSHYIDSICRKHVVIKGLEISITDNYRSKFFANYAKSV